MTSLSGMHAPYQRKRPLAVGETHGHHAVTEADFGGVQNEAHLLPWLLKRRKQLPGERTVKVSRGHTTIFQKATQTVGQAHHLAGEGPLASHFSQVHALGQKQPRRQKRQIAKASDAPAGKKLLHGSEHFSIEAKVVTHNGSEGGLKSGNSISYTDLGGAAFPFSMDLVAK